jgi:Family of unknown function (DUF6516)
LAHGPNSLRAYLQIHETCLANLKARPSRFVGDDTLEFSFKPSRVEISGEISCLGDIVIAVRKTLGVLSGQGMDAVVATNAYAYNASVRGHDNFLRYDNAHPHPEHHDDHHRHDMNWRTGEELPGSPCWVGASGWPTLTQFIEFAEEWYWEHLTQLPNAHEYAVLR